MKYSPLILLYENVDKSSTLVVTLTFTASSIFVSALFLSVVICYCCKKKKDNDDEDDDEEAKIEKPGVSSPVKRQSFKELPKKDKEESKPVHKTPDAPIVLNVTTKSEVEKTGTKSEEPNKSKEPAGVDPSRLPDYLKPAAPFTGHWEPHSSLQLSLPPLIDSTSKCAPFADAAAAKQAPAKQEHQNLEVKPKEVKSKKEPTSKKTAKSEKSSAKRTSK